MKKHIIRNKKVRYAGISLLLTVVVLVVTVLANVVVDSLVSRYGLYTSLLGERSFDVSEDCFELLEDAFDQARAEGKEDEVKIIFCNTEAAVSEYSAVNYYLYHTVQDLTSRFDNIKTEYVDIFTNPTDTLRGYTYSTHPLTGETIETPIGTNHVIVVCGDYHRVYTANDFYAFSNDEDVNSLWAYNGEKKISSAILRAIENETRIACLLVNHGEALLDYEMMSLLSDAGYTVATLDFYKEDIPENCELIISYNPKTDLVADELSEKSETEMLDKFLETSGRAFYVFLDKNTQSLPNFERYLGEWGVATDYWASNGVSYRHSVQDETASLTSDGCTIYGTAVEGSTLASDADFVVFRNATSLRVASEGYWRGDNGGYESADGTRTMYPVYRSGDGAVSWANGIAVDDGAATLITMTEQKNGEGSSYVGVISSVEFAKREYLQSAVYGNADVLMHLFGATGGPATTEGLTLIPFEFYDISTITTAQMLRWTLVLTIVPAVAIGVTALVVLLRRRRA